MVSTSLATSLLECLGELLARHAVELAYLFGSTVTGKATSLSDVDIAVVLKEEDFEHVSRLKVELELEEEIARACGISDVDVRVINDAPIMVRGEVITNGILLYSRDEVFRVEFETSTRSEYFDIMPVAAMHSRTYFERLSQRGSND